VFLSIITLSVLLSPFLAAALFLAAHPLCRCHFGPLLAPTSPLWEQLLPQLDLSCEANREKDEGERVPADPPGLMKIHLLSRDERLINQVHFTTDYILFNRVCDE